MDFMFVAIRRMSSNLIQNVFAAAWLEGTTTFSIKTKSGQTLGNRAKTDQFFGSALWVLFNFD
jgi:hypothetical protein